MSLEDTDEPPVDLTGAEVYVEVGRPVAGGRWYIPRPDMVPTDQPDLVVYQRATGKYTYRSMVSQEDLRSKPTWKRLDPASTD
jgi:hypothetical protein